tara:strand:+ start:593 stop:724 length:132 start_codon:yes stop_codon:yes gene_type:complete
MEKNPQDSYVDKVRFTWKWKYTLVLLFNIGYILLFYFIMKKFA